MNVVKFIYKQVNNSMMRVFFLFCFVMCLFSNAVYTQTDKAKTKTEQREHLLAQLEKQTEIFLATIDAKREQIKVKKDALEIELANLKAVKTKKKDLAAKEQKMQELDKKIAALVNKDREYGKMRNQAISLQTTVDEMHSGIAGSSKQKTSTTTQLQNAEEKRQVVSDKIDENTASFLEAITTKQAQNQTQKEALERELADLQAEKTKKKNLAEKEQKIQDLKKKIAALENKDKEFQKIKNEAIAMQAAMQEQATASDKKTNNASQSSQNQINSNLSTQKSSSGSTSSLTSKSTSSSTSTQTRSQTSESLNNNNKSIIPFANVDAGIYVVFGSFKEKKNAERMLSKLRKQYSNAVAMGNDSPVGMYRIAIGPYKTKEEAIAKKPQDVETWILRCGK
jgi:chromosome segregation ATPase